MSEIECKKLIIGYNGTPLCEPIDLIVEQGQYLFIIGENGSGKSSFIKTLTGLLPRIDGQITYSIPHQRLGYVSQKHQVYTDFPATSFEVIQSGGLYKLKKSPFYKKEDKKAVRELMASLKISHLAEKSFHHLSGGQKQRVLIARALMTTDRLLILDEPINGLDPTTRREVYDMLKELHQKGITIIMVSHDHEAAYQYGTHILTFESGKYRHMVNENLIEDEKEVVTCRSN
ncbi:MAG: ABC transporter [Firmicutes bacterium HGW-Firmicutes-2]|jgi:zinc transport system ATP-binding protein|nr:MAG: ABC transporter [Firmicutes bacterium HGW-Firmicutes-2]